MDGDAIDQLAEQLRSDPVVVDVAMGDGRAAEHDDRLTALVKQLPFKAYVALVEQPDGLPAGSAAELPGLLHRRIGEPGLYVVDTTDGIFTFEVFGSDLPQLRDTFHGTLDEVGRRVATQHDVRSVVLNGPLAAEVLLRTAASGDRALTEADVVELSERADELYSAAWWREPQQDRSRLYEAQMSVGWPWVAGTVMAWAVFCLVLLLLRNLVPQRTGRRVDLSRLRTHATSQVAALAEALAETDWDAVADRDAGDRAGLARDAAEPLLESDHLTDLVGAQVLALTGLRDLEIARGAADQLYRACFVDPRHGEATGQMRWRLGQGDAQVPVCGRCREADAKGTPPQPMPRERHGELRRVDPRAWFEVDDVWTRTGFGALTDEFAGDVLTAHRRGRR